MSNIKLTGHTWDTSGIYDDAQGKTQAEVNSGLKNALSSVENLEYAPLPFSNGGSGYINYKNGTTTSDSSFDHTDYIDVSKYFTIKYKRTGTTSTGDVSTGIAFYDGNRNYLFGVPTAKNQATIGYLSGLFEVPVPTSAKFMQCTIYHDTSTYGEFKIYGVSSIVNTNEEINNVIDDTIESRQSTNIFDGCIDAGVYCRNTDGYLGIASTLGYTLDYISVEEGEIIVLGYRDGIAENMRYITAYNSSKEIMSSSGSGSDVKSYTVPEGVAYIRISAALSILTNAKARINKGGIVLPYERYGNVYESKLSETVHSYNWINPEEITANSGYSMRTGGTKVLESDFSYTGYIPVNEGDKVYVLQNSYPHGNGRFRYVTAYNENFEAISASGTDITGRVYTVPSGIKYVIVTIFLEDYNLGKLSINVGRMMPYDDYSVEEMPTGVGENKTNVTLLEKMPLETMPPYVVNTLAYKPLTAPTKGYFCFVTDDGHEDMVTYTIPMVIDRQIPCTFAVFKNSACFATTAQTEVVVDAVENHGCAISQHGGRNWTEFSEYGLNQFFDDEKAFFDELGLSVNSAVIPSHYMSKVVQAVAGGRFGVVRSGGLGYDKDGNYGGMVRNWYDYFTSGAGSNLYGLSSYNLTTKTLASNKEAVDYAYANKTILIGYIHELSLDAEKKGILEDTIDYAKTKGLEFITLDQIPYLNEGTITM